MQKYAVYKTETGQYCYRYADSLQQLSGTGFEDLVREDQLPIVLDDRGGYFQFDPNDHHFVEVIESDKKFPLPLDRMFKHNDPAFQLGWISPDGETYSCGYTNHNKCAETIVRTFYPAARFRHSSGRCRPGRQQGLDRGHRLMGRQRTPPRSVCAFRAWQDNTQAGRQAF